jgi:hypothetical protein
MPQQGAQCCEMAVKAQFRDRLGELLNETVV